MGGRWHSVFIVATEDRLRVMWADARGPTSTGMHPSSADGTTVSRTVSDNICVCRHAVNSIITSFTGAIAPALSWIIGLKIAEIAVNSIVRPGNFMLAPCGCMRALAEADGPLTEGPKPSH